jgi:septal ring factor EnvC (AmiA/AmiB activator)
MTDLETLEAELTANERMVDALQFALRDAVETATENARQRDAANHRIEALEAENARFRKALEFYADDQPFGNEARKALGVG